MSGFDVIARKITRPPGAQNCARLNAIGDEAATANLIARFALAIPPFNYLPALAQCKTHVQLGLTMQTAKAAVMERGAPAGRLHNAALVQSFFDYDAIRKYSDCRTFENFDGEYRLSREIRVPTKPTFTILENGKLVPITVCGWKTLPLTREQMRFWMTMLEEGLYSHTDYRRSPAEVLLFLENDSCEHGVRTSHIIRRGDYDLLSSTQMREQADLYLRAQSAALPIAEAIWNEKQKKRKQEDRQDEASYGTLYDGPSLFD